jgi:hypothetical protein
MKTMNPAFLIMIIFTVIITACTVQENAINNTDNNPVSCGECPMLSSPAPGWCSEGKIVSGGVNKCNCTLPPKCEKKELMKNICSEDSRKGNICTMEYMPVCGWFSENMKCFAYPCANTFSNPCAACQNNNVAYWTEGECPKVGANLK